MELIIASTPYDGLRRELLGKPIGHTIRDVLKEGRKFEALSAGNDQLQRLDTKQSDIYAVSYVRKCGNCGTSHKPRQCPAYKDKCSACNAIGHWKCCWKTRTQQRPSSSGKRDDRTPSNRHGNPRRRRTPSSHRKNSKVHSVDTDYETDGESYQQSFYAITVSTQCLDAIDITSTTRDEAFVVLDVQPPGLKGTGYTLRLKIDSGASGNTLPMRTFRQMYGNKADTRNLLEPANGIKLTAYNGEDIRCLGTLDMKCQHKSSGWKTTRFYVVDVPGPAVGGLPTSEILNLVTINVDVVATKPNEQIAMHAMKTHLKPILKKAGNVQKQISINSIEDLKQDNQVINTKEPLMQHTLPTRPWQYIDRVRSVRDRWQAVPTDSGPVFEIPTGRLHAQSCQQSCGNREDEDVLCYVWAAGRDNDRWRPTVLRKTIQRIHEELGHLSHNELTSLPEEQRIYRKTRTTH